MFCLFAAGLMLGMHGGAGVDSAWWFVGAGVLGVVGWCARGVWCRAAMGAAVVAMGAGWFSVRVVETPRDFVGRGLEEDGRRIVALEGLVLRGPETGAASRGRLAEFLPMAEVTRFALDVDRVTDLEGGAGRRGSGVVYVRVSEAMVGVRAGDFVRVEGLASGVRGPDNPGEGDQRLRAAERGAAGFVRVPSRGLVRVVDGDERSWGRRAFARWVRWREGVRGRAREALGLENGEWRGEGEDAGEGHGRGLLAALLLGESDDASRDVRAVFTRLGVAHMLAISGLHLALLAWAAARVMRLFTQRGWVEALVVGASTAAYVIVVPGNTPVLRAALMVWGFMIAEALGRRYDRVNTLAWIAVVLLLWRPMELWSAGFQLSFGVVAALLTLTAPVRERSFGAKPAPDMIGAGARMGWWVKEAAVASIVAWAVSAPVIMHHFGVFSPLAPAMNLLLMPLIGLLLAPGYLVMLVSVVMPGLGGAMAGALRWLGEVFAGVPMALDGAPGMIVNAPMMGAAWAAGATALIAWWLAGGRLRSVRGGCAAGILAVWLGAAVVGDGLRRDVALRLDTLAVGDGACHLVRSGNGAILWDCGSMSLAMGERELPLAVRALGARVAPTVVISHPNLDHYSALLDAAPALGVERVVVGEAFVQAAEDDPDGPVAFVRRGLERMGVRVEVVAAGDEIRVGSVIGRVISPARGTTWRRANDASLVAVFEAPTAAGPRRLLLCGDIETEAMASILETWTEPGADAMEAPHHGSARPAAFDFVTRLDPDVVVQSTGPSRLGDERWDDVKRGRTWLTTAADGAAWVEIGRDGAVRAGAMRRAGAPVAEASPTQP